MIIYFQSLDILNPVHTNNNTVECYKVECCFDIVAGVDRALVDHAVYFRLTVFCLFLFPLLVVACKSYCVASVLLALLSVHDLNE